MSGRTRTCASPSSRSSGSSSTPLITPWVAYFLLAVGGSLIVFEFFTISIGIAGVIGAASLVLAFYGFSHLPMHWWAVALVLSRVRGVRNRRAGGRPRAMDGDRRRVARGRLDFPLWRHRAGATGVVDCSSYARGHSLFMIGGMTAMLRSRFGTPTVGREGMIGEIGLAEVDIAPDGVAGVREALWRARTNRATPIKHGEIVRVVAVEGLVLEVEPERWGQGPPRPRPARS